MIDVNSDGMNNDCHKIISNTSKYWYGEKFSMISNTGTKSKNFNKT